jgi:RNA polymerase sigma factor (sigma-70 family)
MERLRTLFLNVALTEVTHPPSASAQLAATEQNTAAGTAPPVKEAELTAQQQLERAVASLPPRYRMVFVLHDIEEFGHDDIAIMLDCSAATSRSQLSKARLMLRRLMGLEGGEKLEQIFRDHKSASRTSQGT